MSCAASALGLMVSTRAHRLPVQDAAAAGCTTVSGLEMFVGQAVRQFELFTGRPAPVEVMRSVLTEGLQ